MARQLAEAVHNKFDAGYITEATALNYPPNAVTDTENCVFHFPGNLTRRKGFNFEVGYVIEALDDLGITFDDKTITSFYWQNASGIGSINFAVVQVGSFILFFQVGQSGSLSAGYTGININLDDYATAGNPGVASLACQYAAGDGYLFICHPYTDPIYIAYNDDGTLTVKPITLRIRDLTGIADIDPATGIDQNVGNGISHRPSDLVNPHIYNLYNQGWFVRDVVVEYPTFTGTDGNPFTFPAVQPQCLFMVVAFKTNGMGVYPSNADIWWRFKDIGGAYNPVTTTANVQLGNSRAPQGFFILDAFNQDRSAAVKANVGTASYTSEAANIPLVTSGYFRPSTIAFFAGRVFYSGVQDSQFSNQIYFSRIIEQPAHIGQCYQDDDPTASDLGVADLIASDGGVIKSPEFGTIYKLYSLGYSLLVLTSKGIWSIAGSTGLGFTATDYTVSKVSSIPMQNPQAFIDLDGTPVWWNDDGIYTLQAGGMTSIGSSLQQVKPITYSTIQAFFDTIPPASKAYSTGVYNRSEHTIYWLYSSVAPADVTARYKYDSILCQNTITGAFYKWTVPYNTQLNRYIAGALVIYGTGTNFTSVPVTAADTTDVTLADGTIVTVNSYDTSYIGQVTKFIVIQTLGAVN